MQLSQINSGGIGSNDLLKFVDGPTHDFNSWVGYVITLGHLKKVWGTANGIEVPFKGNCYKIEGISLAELQATTPGWMDESPQGNGGKSDMELPQELCTQISKANSKEEALKIMMNAGFSKGHGFGPGPTRDTHMLYQSIKPGIYFGTEGIVNLKLKHKYVASPIKQDDSGYSLFDLSKVEKGETTKETARVKLPSHVEMTAMPELSLVELLTFNTCEIHGGKLVWPTGDEDGGYAICPKFPGHVVRGNIFEWHGQKARWDHDDGEWHPL